MKKVIKRLLVILLLLTGIGILAGFYFSYKNVSDSETEDSAVTDETSTVTIEEEESVPTTEEIAQDLVSEMSLHEQICQMFIVAPEQLTGETEHVQATDVMQEALQNYPVGGIVYFANNIQTRDQVTSMISDTQSYSQIGLFIAVDEEGGTVARIGNNSEMGTTAFSDMRSIGDTGEPENAYNVGYTIGSEIVELGFNLDFAPVADVDSNPNNPVIGNRSFGSDASLVANMVAAEVEGFQDSGVLCTLKHFPGHGDTATDSHEGYTELDKTLDELWETELIPFQSGIQAGADFVMVGHISVPEVTGNDLPATLSSEMLSLLRQDLNFDGIIITDSMRMEAITERYTSGEAAVMAVQAGVDIILMPEDLSEAVAALESAVEDGTISSERIEESVVRILVAKMENEVIN